MLAHPPLEFPGNPDIVAHADSSRKLDIPVASFRVLSEFFLSKPKEYFDSLLCHVPDPALALHPDSSHSFVMRRPVENHRFS